MNKKIEIKSSSAEKTFKTAFKLGELIKAPCTIGLSGELGAGKTLFTQGFAQGLGLSDKVYLTSPSYSIINSYQARFTLHHADLYRLNHYDEIYDTGLLELLSSDAVSIVEWAELMEDKDIFDIYIRIKVEDETSRILTIENSRLHFYDLLRSWQEACL